MRLKRVSISVLAVVLFLSLFFGSASLTRRQLINNYNQGVQYFENGDYEAAMQVFDGLRGWGNCVDILPEDYYDMAFERLSEAKPNITKCPYCGRMVEWK